MLKISCNYLDTTLLHILIMTDYQIMLYYMLYILYCTLIKSLLIVNKKCKNITSHPDIAETKPVNQPMHLLYWPPSQIRTVCPSLSLHRFYKFSDEWFWETTLINDSWVICSLHTSWLLASSVNSKISQSLGMTPVLQILLNAPEQNIVEQNTSNKDWI